MKSGIKVAISLFSGSVLLLGGTILQAGGWDDFKLRYYHLTQIFHDQHQEFQDLETQQINPENVTRIELEQLLNGGPPKDGIPSIDNPQFDLPEQTPFSGQDTVIGVVVNGEAKAYPFNVMNWHEIANDNLGGVNITVSYCPLCDTIVVFERGRTTFGVSGKLYQSCLIMYDRQDDTLYAQPWGMGVVGPQVNQSLNRIPAVKTTLDNWLAQYPDSLVLAERTGHVRNYHTYPYGQYDTNEQIVFPVRNQSQRQLHPKATVSYVWETDRAMPHNQFSGVSQQFVHQELQQVGTQVLELGDRKIQARWDRALETVIVEEMDGTPIPSTTAFAFVYPAFYGY